MHQNAPLPDKKIKKFWERPPQIPPLLGGGYPRPQTPPLVTAAETRHEVDGRYLLSPVW